MVSLVVKLLHHSLVQYMLQLNLLWGEASSEPVQCHQQRTCREFDVVSQALVLVVFIWCAWEEGWFVSSVCFGVCALAVARPDARDQEQVKLLLLFEVCDQLGGTAEPHHTFHLFELGRGWLVAEAKPAVGRTGSHGNEC